MSQFCIHCFIGLKPSYFAFEIYLYFPLLTRYPYEAEEIVIFYSPANFSTPCRFAVAGINLGGVLFIGRIGCFGPLSPPALAPELNRARLRRRKGSAATLRCTNYPMRSADAEGGGLTESKGWRIGGGGDTSHRSFFYLNGFCFISALVRMCCKPR